MLTLLRPVLALCTIVLLGLTAPAGAAKPSFTTADPQVCCSGNDAAGNLIFFYAPKSQCPRDKVAHPDRCKPRPVCCKSPNGYYQTTSDRCRPPGAQIVPDSYCKQKPVCCKTPNGILQAPSAERCKAAGGSIVPDSYCKQKPVCCRTPNGILQAPSAERCKAAGGTIVADSYCRRETCCKTRNGYQMVPAAKCRPPVGSPAPAHLCRKPPQERVCCKTRKGYSFENAAKCRPPVGTPAPAYYCRQQPTNRICCKYPKADGTAAFAFLDPRRCKALGGSQVNSRYCPRIQPAPTLRRTPQ